MTRKFPEKDRDEKNRREKIKILIVAEGKNNQTEKNYFNSFRKPNGKYDLLARGTGGSTDPLHMKEKFEEWWKNEELSSSNGDLGFIVLDLDCNKVDKTKASTIKSLSRQLGKNVSFIVSNPCFEVWFLLHFRYSTRSFISSDEAINELHKYIPGYVKKKNVSNDLADKLKTALDNAERLNNRYDSENLDWPSDKCNPRTDVPTIIHTLRDIETGRPGKLSDEEKAEIKKILLERPDKYGYRVWDATSLSDCISSRYGIKYSTMQCQHLFHELGFS